MTMGMGIQSRRVTFRHIWTHPGGLFVNRTVRCMCCGYVGERWSFAQGAKTWFTSIYSELPLI